MKNVIFSAVANQLINPFQLMELPYDKNAFGVLSKETFDYHYDKHHRTYVNKLNDLIKSQEKLQQKNLEEIILFAYKNNLQAIFNNAAQVWNHNFFWHSITPDYKMPNEEMLQIIDNSFSNYDNFIESFKTLGMKQFGSGWIWLVYHNNKIDLEITSNANNPITDNKYPIAVCDLWEHSYYIDYRNDRLGYMDKFLRQMINWQFIYDNIKNL